MGTNKQLSANKSMTPAALKDYEELCKNLTPDQVEVLEKGEGFIEVPTAELRRRRCSVYAYLM